MALRMKQGLSLDMLRRVIERLEDPEANALKVKAIKEDPMSVFGQGKNVQPLSVDRALMVNERQNQLLISVLKHLAADLHEEPANRSVMAGFTLHLAMILAGAAEDMAGYATTQKAVKLAHVQLETLKPLFGVIDFITKAAESATSGKPPQESQDFTRDEPEAKSAPPKGPSEERPT